MSQPADPQDSASPVGPGRPGPPSTVRLPTWVNVVLVLILFASCAGANNSERLSSDSDQVADEVVQRLGGDGADGTAGGLATRDDVRQMCHLLAQVAAKQGLKAAGIVAGDTPSACQDGVADAQP
jgi:hypothetical protein